MLCLLHILSINYIYNNNYYYINNNNNNNRDHVNSRPADVLVQGWDRGKPAAFYVTVASPITPVTLNNASTSVGAAAYAAELRKHVANDTRCQELGWTCIPLAVETYSNWGMEAQSVFFPSRLSTCHRPGHSQTQNAG